MLACIGKFLEGNGVKEILVQAKYFGPDTMKAVINGRPYNRSKRGLNILTFVSNCREHQIKNVLWV